MEGEVDLVVWVMIEVKAVEGRHGIGGAVCVVRLLDPPQRVRGCNGLLKASGFCGVLMPCEDHGVQVKSVVVAFREVEVAGEYGRMCLRTWYVRRHCVGEFLTVIFLVGAGMVVTVDNAEVTGGRVLQGKFESHAFHDLCDGRFLYWNKVL